jgi:cysteine desulfurase
VSAIEHPSVLNSAPGAALIAVGGTGFIDADSYKKTLKRKKPKLVSVMLANNEIGTIQDIAKLAHLAHRAGALFHTDAVQALGKTHVDVKTSNVDFATFSGHKIGALKGVGALYIKEGLKLNPLLKGGYQESRLRAGTENTPSIISFGLAAKQARKNLHKYQDLSHLRDYLAHEISENIEGITVNGSLSARFGALLPNTLNISFASVEGESLLLLLDEKGIAVSTGSACAAGSGKPSHVLMAIKADPELAHGSIRFSLGLETTKKDLDYTVKILKESVEKLRGFSSAGISPNIAAAKETK